MPKSKPQWDSTSHLLEWLSSLRQEITSVGEDVEKREPSCTVNGDVKCCSRYGNSMEIPPKIKNRMPYDPAIPFIGIYPKKMKAWIKKDTCTPMLM